MTFELCIPAYNEAPTILESLRRLSLCLPAGASIVVAENGSTDGTADIVERAALPGTRVLRIKGKGKGLAVREAAASSTAEAFGFIDADLSADPAVIPDMLRWLADGADLVIGSRMLDVSGVNRGALRSLSSRAFNALSRLLLGLRCSDTQCGLKIMNRRGVRALCEGREDGWFFDLELLSRAKTQGLRTEEVPVSWEELRFPGRQSKLRVWNDAWEGLAAMRRIRRGRR